MQIQHLGLCSCGGVRVWSKEAGLGKLAKCNNLPESDKGWQRFKKPAAVGLHGFKPHPPHYLYVTNEMMDLDENR